MAVTCMTLNFRLEAIEAAIRDFGTPEILAVSHINMHGKD
jgi:hypothetical protein